MLAGHFYLTALVAALGIAFASLMQAAVGGAVLRKVIGYPAQFDNSRELSLFLLLSPIFCLLSATISIAVLWALGVAQPADLITNWTTWWAGDALGVLVTLPLMLIMAGEPRAQWRSRTGYVAIPMVLCFALFVAVFVREVMAGAVWQTPSHRRKNMKRLGDVRKHTPFFARSSASGDDGRVHRASLGCSWGLL